MKPVETLTNGTLVYVSQTHRFGTDALLLADFAQSIDATTIVKGLRAMSDFEYEFQLAAGNEYLDKGIETIFLMASSGKGFISSSSIKEFHKHGVKIDELVPKIVIERFDKKEN